MLCYLHLFPYLFILVFCLIFSYYVSSVFCERSAQASEASVAREATQTHAQFWTIVKNVSVFMFLCVVVCLSLCFLYFWVIVHLSGLFVQACLHTSTYSRFPFLCQSGSCWEFFSFFFGYVGSCWRSWVPCWFKMSPSWLKMAQHSAKMSQHSAKMRQHSSTWPPNVSRWSARTSKNLKKPFVFQCFLKS